MATIHLITHIHAPVARCFDLSRSIDLHQHTTSKTNEKAIAGCTSGLIGLGETVTWEATHFYVRQKLSSKITEMKKPHYFVDEMLEGAFKSIRHEHHFEEKDGITTMRDSFAYQTPFFPFGWLFDMLILKRYLTRFIAERNAIIKEMAEGEGWKSFV